MKDKKNKLPREERREYQESQIRYKKVRGRYVPTNDPWAFEGLQEGCWLVIVKAGCTTIRECVWPAKAEVLAAMTIAEEAMTHAMYEESKLKPAVSYHSDVWKKAWKKFEDAVGTELLPSTLTGSSMSKVAKAGMAALRLEDR